MNTVKFDIAKIKKETDKAICVQLYKLNGKDKTFGLWFPKSAVSVDDGKITIPNKWFSEFGTPWKLYQQNTKDGFVTILDYKSAGCKRQTVTIANCKKSVYEVFKIREVWESSIKTIYNLHNIKVKTPGGSFILISREKKKLYKKKIFDANISTYEDMPNFMAAQPVGPKISREIYCSHISTKTSHTYFNYGSEKRVAEYNVYIKS